MTPPLLIALLATGCAYITDKEFAERIGTADPAPEITDTGTVDCEEKSTFWIDADADGYGDPETQVLRCELEEGLAENGDDCDDTDDTVGPEIEWTVDEDGDGFGGEGAGVWACEPPSGAVGEAGDCDDLDPAVNPGAEEDCSTEADDDCSGTNNDEDAANCLELWTDEDADGFGTGDAVCLCEATDDLADVDGDCDDSDEDVHPDVDEICGDGIDNDCDGTAGTCGVSGERDLGGADGRLLGVLAEGRAGGTLAGGADLDGDGSPDLAVGAFYVQSAKGRAYIATGSWSETVGLDTFSSVSGESAGVRLSRGISVGDLNNDGQADLLLGSPQYNVDLPYAAGAAYILPGPMDGTESIDDAVRITGSSASGYLGRSVATIEDFDGDGVNELLVGCYGCNGAVGGSGAAFLVPGMPEDDQSMASSFSLKLGGMTSGEQAGFAVSSAGDIDGDGLDDLLVGARYAGSPASGYTYVLLSATGYEGVISLEDSDGILQGQSGDQAGAVLSALSDVDGDGSDDFAVGAPGHDGDAVDQGAVYVVTEVGAGNAELVDVAEAILLGASGDDALGSSVDGAGDVNDDGIADLIVGLPGATGLTSGSGAAWVFHGPMSATLSEDDAAAQLLGIAANEQAGVAVAGLGDVNGDGHDDVAVAASEATTSEVRAGRVFIVLGGGI